MTRFPSTRATMAPDLDSRSRYFPPLAAANAGPRLVQWIRSRDVATARRGMRRVPLRDVGGEGAASGPAPPRVLAPPRPPPTGPPAPPRGSPRPPPPLQRRPAPA